MAEGYKAIRKGDLGQHLGKNIAEMNHVPNLEKHWDEAIESNIKIVALIEKGKSQNFRY